MRQKRSAFIIFATILSVPIFFLGQFAFAATHTVSTSADFKKWAKGAQPGDVITVKPGSYSHWGVIKFEASGTESQLITYKVNNSGDVKFEDVIAFRVRADWIVIENFDFHRVGSEHPYSAIDIGYSYGSRITNCRFFSCGIASKSWAGNIELLTGAKFSRIDHCLFDDAQSYMIGSDVDCTQDWPKDIQIDHNTFQNSSAYCAIQTASGRKSSSSEATRYTVEYNTFENFFTSKNAEIIGNKSSGNVYRFNIFRDSPNGRLSLRAGHDCRIEGNRVENCASGIRITGKRHVIINNLFYNNKRGFEFTYGDTSDYNISAGGGGYVAAKDCIIAYNTVIGLSGQNIMICNNAGYERATIRPSHNRIINNVFIADHDRFIQKDLSDNNVNRNIFHTIDNQTAIGILGTNYMLTDPKLVGTGVGLRLSPSSQAIGRAVAISGFAIAADLDGNSRPMGARNDIGASEFMDRESPLPPQHLTRTKK